MLFILLMMFFVWCWWLWVPSTILFIVLAAVSKHAEWLWGIPVAIIIEEIWWIAYFSEHVK
jgi:hypothetical protein